MKSNLSRPPIGYWWMMELICLVCPPPDTSFHVWHPPDACKFLLCPQIFLPIRDDLVQRVKTLSPFNPESRNGLEGDLSDDAQCTQTNKSRTKKLYILFY
jgi:hypothetical protein